jgi:pectate lyase
MRGSFTGSLSRLAIVALVTSSFTIPIILEASPAMARAAAGATGGAAGAAGGATGGSTGGSTGNNQRRRSASRSAATFPGAGRQTVW